MLLMKHCSVSILLVPFVVVLIVLNVAQASDTNGPKPDDVVSRVNGVSILRRDLQGEAGRILPWNSFHGKVDPAKQQAIARIALKNLIDAELKYQEAKRRGISVSAGEIDADLQRVIDRYPDKKSFRSELERSGLRVEQLKEEFGRRRMIANVEAEIADADRLLTDEEARRYYEEHLSDFQQPKRSVVRRLFIRMPPTQRTEEDWHRAEQRARNLKQRAEVGEDFGALVREASEAGEQEREQGGLLGPVHPGQLEKELDAVLGSLPEGSTSEPVRSFKGIYLLHVDKVLPPRQVPFEEVRESVKSDLQKKATQNRVADWLAGLHKSAQIEIVDSVLGSE